METHCSQCRLSLRRHHTATNRAVIVIRSCLSFSSVSRGIGVAYADLDREPETTAGCDLVTVLSVLQLPYQLNAVTDPRRATHTGMARQ